MFVILTAYFIWASVIRGKNIIYENILKLYNQGSKVVQQ